MFDCLSFWNPSPIPEIGDLSIQATDLKPIGKADEVLETLLDIPVVVRPKPTINDLLKFKSTQVKLLVEARPSIILYFEPERDGNVLVIKTQTIFVDKSFYRLFVQIYERFGVTVLDSTTHSFLRPKDFKRLYN